MERDINHRQEERENKTETSILKFKASAIDFDTKLWTVASGKGGVGKTFISSSLGLTLSKLGHSVVIVDLDLSGANIHTTLGLAPSSKNIRQFFEGTASAQDLVIATPYPRLSYIQGFWDAWAPTDFSLEQMQILMPELRKLKADYVIIDLGAGALPCHLEVFKQADEKFLISSPEPTSIEKTYRFLEAYICHSLKADAVPEAYENLLSILRQHRQRTLQKPFSFRSYLREQSGFHSDLFENLLKSPIRLLINSSRSQSNEELGHSMKSVCNKYYDLSIDYAGAIDYDNAVWQSLRSKEPVLVAQPFTPLAGQFLATCKHLIDPKELRAVV